jgi:tRNA G37 N-methylase Trm5
VWPLQNRGGWLHVHENVKDSEEANWIESTVEKFAELAADAGRQWKVSKAHLERVKWCAALHLTPPQKKNLNQKN